LKIPFGNVFEGFLTRSYELNAKTCGVILLHSEMDINASGRSFSKTNKKFRECRMATAAGTSLIYEL
jgi:hypothetical protein